MGNDRRFRFHYARTGLGKSLGTKVQRPDLLLSYPDFCLTLYVRIRVRSAGRGRELTFASDSTSAKGTTAGNRKIKWDEIRFRVRTSIENSIVSREPCNFASRSVILNSIRYNKRVCRFSFSPYPFVVGCHVSTTFSGTIACIYIL